MNAPRIVGTIIVRGGLHVQSLGFKQYLPLGCPVESAKEFDRWGIDEIALILLDKNFKLNLNTISEVSSAVSVPVAAVGGLRSIMDAKAYVSGGADKIGFNYSLFENPQMVHEATKIFGQQCIIASIDLVHYKSKLQHWNYWENKCSKYNITSLIDKIKQVNVGEILLNFPEKDGSGTGMDLVAIKKIVQISQTPVIALGGVGSVKHIVNCFKSANPSAIGIGNRLSHFEHSVYLFKKGLKDIGAPVRTGVNPCYDDSMIDHDGRPINKSEKELEELNFQQIEPQMP